RGNALACVCVYVTCVSACTGYNVTARTHTVLTAARPRGLLIGRAPTAVRLPVVRREDGDRLELMNSQHQAHRNLLSYMHFGPICTLGSKRRKKSQGKLINCWLCSLTFIPFDVRPVLTVD
uniref:Secreted protein n=1 Tax=Mesocestoides corti TaxID=53468 RepID=A0A5K3EH78_MESCO